MAITESVRSDARSDDEARVLELCGRLLTERPPGRTSPVELLGHQFDLGLAWVHFPEGHGGLGLSPKLQKLINETLAKAGAPRAGGLNPIGHGMGAPTIVTHGSEAQKQRYLRPLFTNEEIWCQLFSEPGAGSDVAGLSSRAVCDGDEWVVNGQKVWSSGAHYAHFGILLARTNLDVPKHRGLTCFACPMDIPGIEPRPLRQMTGAANFNEVFLTDARIADEWRIGGVDDGWSVARTLLANERMSLSGADGAFSFEQLADAARERPDRVDPVVRDRMARLYTQVRTLDFLNARVMTKLGRGETPTAEASVMKLALAAIVTEGATIALGLLGPEGMLGDTPQSHRLVGSPAMHIGGGTDEVNKNIVAERVLGLPRDRSR